MKSLIIAITVLLAFTGSAFANECPSLIKKDEDMAKAMKVDAATKTKVEDLIALAKKKHAAGEHDASVAAAKEAAKIIGM